LKVYPRGESRRGVSGQKWHKCVPEGFYECKAGRSKKFMKKVFEWPFVTKLSEVIGLLLFFIAVCPLTGKSIKIFSKILVSNT
jgi:hypothetical protein